MKKCKYENITIEQAERIIGTGYITELICDADSRTVNINEDEYLKVEEIIKETISDVKRTLEPVIKSLSDAFGTLAETSRSFATALVGIAESIARNLSNKKITKRKFIKLLQSQGIQRNEINKIIKNNKEPYTFYRYYNIVISYQNKTINNKNDRNNNL